MVGETLSKIRARIERLASPSGSYRVICGRTGVCPVPVAGKRFPDRETAETAAEAAVDYRAVLRRWDPRAPCYDFIACEEPATDAPRTVVSPAPTGTAESLPGFCHDVAAAVFEALSTEGYADIESSIMDVYCESADAIDDPDELCLHLLRTLSFEVGARLSGPEQATVLRSAAAELGATGATDRPLDATFRRLQRLDLVGRYDIEARPEPVVGRQSWTVTVAEYALAGRAASLPTLPIGVDLLCRLPRAEPSLSDVRHLDDDRWRFELVVTEDGSASGLVRARPDGQL